MSYQQKEMKFNHQINSSGQLSMSPFTYIFKQSTNKKNKQTNKPTIQQINQSTNQQTNKHFLIFRSITKATSISLREWT